MKVTKEKTQKGRKLEEITELKVTKEKPKGKETKEITEVKVTKRKTKREGS